MKLKIKQFRQLVEQSINDTSVADALYAAGEYIKSPNGWIELAMWCLDRGGVSMRAQDKIRQALKNYTDEG